MNMPSIYAQPPIPGQLPLNNPGVGKAQASLAGLSLTGVVLFICGLSVVASGYMSLRPIIFGRALHPILIPLAASFPFVVMARIHEFPPRILISLTLFCGIYLASIFNGGFSLSEILKLTSVYVTIVSTALLVRKRGDFVAGALGLTIAVALLAARGMSAESSVDAVMEGANKNSYSMFALPAMLLTSFVCMRMKSTSKLIKLTMLACIVLSLLVIFLGGNRSGYVGAILIALMVFWDQRGRGMVLVAMVIGILVVLITQFGNTDTFDRRMQQTLEGNKSDDLRIRLLQVNLEIALENPILGISPEQVPFEIANRIGVGRSGGYFFSHNVIANVMSGSGLLCLALLFAIGWSLWSPYPKSNFIRGQCPALFDGRRLTRMMAALWFVRGQFTHEILFNPAFNFAIGLSIGLLIIVYKESQHERSQRNYYPGHYGYPG